MQEEPIEVIDALPDASAPRPASVRARGVRPAIAALAVAVVGLAVFGGALSFRDPPPHPSPGPGEPCRPVDAGGPSPELRLSRLGASSDVPGITGGEGLVDPSASWQLPGLEMALLADEADSLRLGGPSGSCLAAISVQIGPAYAQTPPGPAERSVVLRRAYTTPAPSATIDGVRPGPWVLEAVATWWTGPSGPRLATETFFRMHIGDAATLANGPAASPLVTPSASCGAAPGAAGTRLTASVAAGAPVAGGTPGDPLPTVSLPIGAPVTIEVEGLACATSWRIELRNDDLIQILADEANAGNDPGRAAQNRWKVLPVGGGQLVAIVRFGTDITVERAWQIVIPPSDPLDVAVVDASGASHPLASACAISVYQANSSALEASCELVPERLASLAIAPGSAATLVVAGWSIVEWHGRCGVVIVNGATRTFHAAGCNVGGYAVTGATEPPPARFLVPGADGPQVLRFDLTATRGGDTVVAVGYAALPAR